MNRDDFHLLIDKKFMIPDVFVLSSEICVSSVFWCLGENENYFARDLNEKIGRWINFISHRFYVLFARFYGLLTVEEN